MPLLSPIGPAVRTQLQPPSHRPLRVLLVEDNMVLRRVMLEALGKAGLEARATRDAMDAATLAYRHPVDLVIAEEKLPGMGGVALARSLSALPHPPRFALLTSSPSPSLTKEGFRAGVDWILPKPLGLDSLKSMTGRIRQTGFPPLRLPGRRSARPSRSDA